MVRGSDRHTHDVRHGDITTNDSYGSAVGDR
jgi:hypothetical protein